MPDSILFEILPNDKVLIEVKMSNDKDPEHFVNLLNGILMRQYLPSMVDAILKSGKHNSLETKAKNICDGVINFQQLIEIRQKSLSRRNPAIKPRQVFNIQQG